ncbi:MAG TPA: DNA repair protein RadA [Acidimicrobiales bacterium]|nr:DNA repair protein RadA [Acidimicrobiales bacterium]
MRDRTQHRCSACGGSFARWSGRCPQCASWGTLVLEHAGRRRAVGLAAQAVPIEAIPCGAGEPYATGLGELDRALGGGLVPGSVSLLSGEPGIGKSTLLLQGAAALAAQGRRCLIVSAEESAEQVRRRAARLGAVVAGLHLLETTSLAAALEVAEELRPDLLVVDSIQTVADPAAAAGAGSVAQVRECAARLAAHAKASGTATILVGHVTKDGALAGPRALEHLVDTVLRFEGDRHHALRVLHVLKHRFGPAGEVGVFELTGAGLEGVADPSAHLLADRLPSVPGSVVVPVLEGHRPLLVELQALVTPSQLALPRRVAGGLPGGRLALVLAVLEQRAGVALSGADVFTSVVGGLRVAEPAVDLALALALASAAAGAVLGGDLVAFGEVGLGGELRQVTHVQRRLAEAARRGFCRAVVPASTPAPCGAIELVRAATLAEAIAAAGCAPAPG